MAKDLSLRHDADEHFDVVPAGRTFHCDGNGNGITSADFRRDDDCDEKIRVGKKHLLKYARVQPTKIVGPRYCAHCARRFFKHAVT